MTAPVRVSPSQADLFRLCARRWAFTYLHGRREPDARSTALGSAVHAVHEAYLKHGTVPDPFASWSFASYLATELASGEPERVAAANATLEVDPAAATDHRTFYPGRIALNMMPAGIYPAPGVGHVEDDFAFERDGVLWNGFVDWHNFNPSAPPAEFEALPGRAERGLVAVMDHKTSADPLKWGKTEETLAVDTQAIVYARAMLERYGSANVVLHWNYGAVDAHPGKSKVTTVRFVPGQVYALFENQVQPIGVQIRRLRLAAPDPLSLPPTPSACHVYHKACPFLNDCNLTTQERLGDLVMGNALIDSLLAEAGAAPAPAPTPAAPAAARPLPPLPQGSTVNPPEAATVRPAAPAIPLPVAPAGAAARPAPVPPVAPPQSAAEAGAEAAAAVAAPKRPRPRAAPAAAPDPGAAAPAPSPAPAAAARPLPVPTGAPAGADPFGSEFADKLADKLADRIMAKLFG